MATQDKDSPLDRYEVKEILCMRCNALQPASDVCINPGCESRGKPFSRYTCKICNFYDDTPNKAIYHCPFCNVCRSGQGLGVDYRHCMRCNACVSLTDEHHCIPQRLQGNCPICHESMFESTEPLRGMKCGHGKPCCAIKKTCLTSFLIHLVVQWCIYHALLPICAEQTTRVHCAKSQQTTWVSTSPYLIQLSGCNPCHRHTLQPLVTFTARIVVRWATWAITLLDWNAVIVEVIIRGNCRGWMPTLWLICMVIDECAGLN